MRARAGLDTFFLLPFFNPSLICDNTSHMAHITIVESLLDNAEVNKLNPSSDRGSA
jgi:hypothetical protein